MEYSPPIIDEKAVVVLSDKNFSHVISKNRFVMVAFYAPWCYWSQKLAPEYEKAATELKGEVMLANVDAVKETNLAMKYEIQGYPTIYFFVGGVKIDTYYHERKRDAILKWIRTKVDLGIYTITTTKQAELALMAESKIVLGFFDSLQGLDSDELAAVSNLYGDIIFYQTTSADVAKMFQIDPEIKRPALFLLEKESHDLSHFNGPFTKYAIADFISLNQLPPVTAFTNENALLVLKSPMKQGSRNIFNGEENNLSPVTAERDVVVLSEKNFSHVVVKNRHVIVNFYAPWSYYSQQFAPEYGMAATELKGKVVLAKVDAYKEKELKKKYKAQGHPNIYFFVGGVKVDSYTNARRRDAIVKWIKTKMALGVYTITTIEQAEQVMMARSMIALAFFDSLQGLECKELAAASKVHTDVIFYQTTSADVAKTFRIDQETKNPALIFLAKESQHLIYFNGPFTKYAIADFISLNKLPPVASLTTENAPLILDSSMQQLFAEDFMEDML